MGDGLTGQRKLAAIMFTDMVGYSALAQKNEALSLELLEEHRRLLRPLFTKHGGREIETVGDAFFVEFTSALDAVRCAIEIQKTLFTRNASAVQERRILLRIGLHLGDVVYVGEHVHGDGVNIAARVQPLAEPGGICVSEDVARQVQNKTGVPIVMLGKGELKNIRMPVSLYKLVMPWEKKRLPFSDRLSFALRKKKTHRYGILALAIAVLVSLYVLFPSRAPLGDRISIAVLPFKNLNEDRESEYFSDGITEDVIAHLSKIRKLKVISRTSIMHYKNSEKSLKDIGRELDVATILEGSVRRQGNLVRIVAELIDAYNDENLWAETYDRELTQIFAIQSDVAQNIAAALRAKISPEEKERIEKKATGSVEAYDLYLKGRYHWNKRIPDELREGIEYFEHALDKDSTYALAYAGLADSYTLLGNFNILPPHEAYPKAKAVAAKALEIDDGLAEAHTSLAFAIMFYDWDWPRAEREFKRAIDLNPNYSEAHNWYAFYLTVMGRFREAHVVRRQAQELDPLSVVVKADAGLALYFERRFDEAIEQYRKTLEQDPLFVAVYIPLGGAYVHKSMYEEAFEALSKASMFSRGLPIPVAALGYAYAVSGREEDAQLMLELLKERAGEEYVSPYWISVVYTGLGEKDQAFEWLERAYEEKDGSMILLKVEPIFDGLRSDSRFESLLKKMGFEE